MSYSEAESPSIFLCKQMKFWSSPSTLSALLAV